MIAFLAQFGGVGFADEVTEPSEQSGRAPRIGVDPTGRSDGYSAVLYDNTNGLPTSEANDIAETSEGFIWIGSYSGLIRYDGNTFERMDSTTGIASVTNLCVDSHDRLWIGTNDSGFAMMERGELKMWGTGDGLKSASVRAIIEGDDGTMYIATTSGMATVDPEMNLALLDDPRIADAYMRDIRMGEDGRVYCLTQDGSIFTLRNGKVEHYVEAAELAVKGVIAFMPDPHNPGYMYLGTESSQVYYGSIEDKLSEHTTYDFSPLSYLERFEYVDGKIWVCAGDGIGVLDDQGFLMLENLPMNYSVSNMMVDYEGNLWFTSTRQGVMKIVPNQFADLYDRYDLPESVVNSTCLLDDRLFIGSDSGLTVLEEQGPVKSIPLSGAVTASGQDLGASDLISLLDGCRIRSIVSDSQGRLWIATWLKYGLICYDKGEVTAYSAEDGLYSDRVRVACETHDGSILVASTGGVNVISQGVVAGGYGEDAGIANTEILTVNEADNGDIVLGTDGGGIYIVHDGGTRHIGVEDGLSSGVVMRVKHDAAHNVFWIVTSNSIAYMTEDYKVTTIQKFPYSNNFDLYESDSDDMWVLSSNGIYVVPVTELLANGEIDPVYFGRDNGLPCIATANSYSSLTAQGDLYIAGSTGVAKVNIDTPYEDVGDLKVAVPYIDADDKRVYPNENGSFTIAPDTQRLTVHSYVFNYSLMNPQVSYRLDGFEAENTTVSRSELVPVDYTNLPGGTYHFMVELRDALGEGNKLVSIEVDKQKAFYEQIWFYVLAVIAFLLLVWFIVRFYIRRKTRLLEEKNQETMTLIREITEAFAKVIDMKDEYTNGHSSRVAKYTVMLARELGYDEETQEKYYRIALLHDIGKVGVPATVLNKPGKLTDDEFTTIKSHTTAGYEALKDISIMPELAIGAESHHERPDGRGYPNQLKGDEIPRVAQIIAVADCFDAMYSNRPYRKRMNFDKAVSIIKDVSGTQLTEDVVDAFLRLVEKGEFRDPDDVGGGTTEDIQNIGGEE